MKPRKLQRQHFRTRNLHFCSLLREVQFPKQLFFVTRYRQGICFVYFFFFFLLRIRFVLDLVFQSLGTSIILCPSYLQIETCRKVENALKRFDRRESQVQVLPFHAAMAQESRLANMDEFTNSRPDNVSQFLVCTDR